MQSGDYNALSLSNCSHTVRTLWLFFLRSEIRIRYSWTHHFIKQISAQGPGSVALSLAHEVIA